MGTVSANRNILHCIRGKRLIITSIFVALRLKDLQTFGLKVLKSKSEAKDTRSVFLACFTY